MLSLKFALVWALHSRVALSADTASQYPITAVGVLAIIRSAMSLVVALAQVRAWLPSVGVFILALAPALVFALIFSLAFAPSRWLVHDGQRPFISSGLIGILITGAAGDRLQFLLDEVA